MFQEPDHIEYDHQTYRGKRAIAYPYVGDQLDALYHAGVFPPEMAEQIAAVKAAYPKQEPAE